MKNWQVDAFNEFDEQVETRKMLTPEQLERLVESLSIEQPKNIFVAHTEDQEAFDISWPLEVE